MEYCTTVWSPQGLENIKKLERVQRRFTKRFPGLAETSYLERMKILNLERLELRRIRFDLVMCFNVINNLNGLNFNDFFQLSKTSRETRNSSRNSMLLNVPKKGLNVHAHSFAQRSIKFWNYLSDDVILAPSVDSFKAKLRTIDLGCMCLVNDFI